MKPPEVDIEFFVRGDPKGQPRPRAFARKMGNRYVARVFDAGTAEEWKSAIAFEARGQLPDNPCEGPVSVSLSFAFGRPKSHFVGGVASKGLRDCAPTAHTGKPDADNLAKAVLDALTQLGGYWRDDSQVARLLVDKVYGSTPGCLIRIEEIGK